VSPTTSSPSTSAGGLPVALVLAFAAVLELLLQSLRALFPLGYHLVGSLGFVLTPLVLVPVFAAPLLYPVVQRLAGTRVTVLLVGGLVLARLVLQASPTLGLALIAAVVGLLAMTAVLAVAAGARFGPDVVAAGTLVGLGLDVALRAWRVTDDVVWSGGWQAWLDPSLLVPLVLLGVTLRSLKRGRPAVAASWTWAVLLMPQLLLWTSLAFVSSSGAVPFAVATLALLLSVATAMAVLAARRARLPWPVSAAGVLVPAVAMPWTSGWAVLALAVLGTVATPLLLREAVARAQGRAWSPWRHGATAAGGFVVMFVLLLLYPLHYEIPLPVDNAWLPGVAVLLACLPLLRRPSDEVAAREFAVPSPVHRPAVAFVMVGSLVLAAMVHSGMVGGSPAPGPDPALTAEPADGSLTRVATFNIGQGQDAATGALAFREVTEAMLDLDADVVAVQEVPRGWPLSSMTDFDAWLHAHTDLTVAYTPAADPQFGNALVSRVPLADVSALDLGQGGGAQRRSAISATLPDGLLVYGMHLQARNSAAAEQTRLDQMQQVVDDWAGRPRTVLAGDLNPRNEYADETETPPKVVTNLQVWLEAGLVTTQPTTSCTEPTSNDNCSDYVFTSSDLEPLAPTRVRDVQVSDHRPVVATFASGSE